MVWWTRGFKCCCCCCCCTMHLFTNSYVFADRSVNIHGGCHQPEGLKKLEPLWQPCGWKVCHCMEYCIRRVSDGFGHWKFWFSWLVDWWVVVRINMHLSLKESIVSFLQLDGFCFFHVLLQWFPIWLIFRSNGLPQPPTSQGWGNRKWSTFFSIPVGIGTLSHFFSTHLWWWVSRILWGKNFVSCCRWQ